MVLTENQEKIYKTMTENIQKHGKAGKLYTLVVHPDNLEDAKKASKKYNHDARNQNRKDRITVKTIKLDKQTARV